MVQIVFVVAAVMAVVGALGVIGSRNPVHAALFLLQTLFGVALLFLLQEAHFLAAVQFIVYAGAIAILFLFVIMLLGVDKTEDLEVEPIAHQRFLAPVLGVALASMLFSVFLVSSDILGGSPQFDSERTLDSGITDIERLGRVLFSDHAFAVEITAALLTIAVVGAVALTRSNKSKVKMTSDE